MFKPLPFCIGLRYTAAKRSNHFISFISLTSMLGMMLGVAVLITVLSVMNGFDQELRQRILGMVPHATVSTHGAMYEWELIDEQITAMDEVLAASPYIQAQGMLASNGRVQGVFIDGILPSQEREVSIVGDHIISGDLDDLASGGFGIVIGDLLARSLAVGIGDRVTLVLPEASVTPAGVFPRLRRFTVVGVFKVGAELDSSFGLIHLEDAARLFKLKDGVHGLRLKVADLFQARPVAWEAARQLGPGYVASDWSRTHGSLFQAIQMEKKMIALLLMMIVTVAAFNIISTLVMVVTDKQADIAILRTFGATPAHIMGIFMVQGSLIGIVGTLLGTLLGVSLALNVSEVVAWLEHLIGRSFLSADVYFISYLPSRLIWSDVAMITGASLALGFLATIYPALRASRVNPAEALRYE